MPASNQIFSLHGGCINDYPLPSGRPTYKTMLSCSAMERMADRYRVIIDIAIVISLSAFFFEAVGQLWTWHPIVHIPNSNVPHSFDMKQSIIPTHRQMSFHAWTSWSDSGCSNKLPLPFNNMNDCPNYSAQITCCKGAYGGQVSWFPSPPKTSTTLTCLQSRSGIIAGTC